MTRIFAAAGLLLVTAALAACSSPPREVNNEQSRARVEHIRHVCSTAMGLNSSEAPFSVCVDALKQTAPRKLEALTANQKVAYVEPDDDGKPDHRLAERACFDVGLDPKYAGYWSCVGTLDDSMFHINSMGER